MVARDDRVEDMPWVVNPAKKRRTISSLGFYSYVIFLRSVSFRSFRRDRNSYLVCETFINWTKNHEKLTKNSQRNSWVYTRVRYKLMNFVKSVNRFRCSLMGPECSWLLSVQWFSTCKSCLEWIIRRKYQPDGFRSKCIPAFPECFLWDWSAGPLCRGTACASHLQLSFFGLVILGWRSLVLDGCTSSLIFRGLLMLSHRILSFVHCWCFFFASCPSFVLRVATDASFVYFSVLVDLSFSCWARHFSRGI